VEGVEGIVSGQEMHNVWDTSLTSYLPFDMGWPHVIPIAMEYPSWGIIRLKRYNM